MKRILLIIWALASGSKAIASDKLAFAKSIATLFRSCRAVISDNQDLINDASKGDKGLNAASVVKKCKENFQAKTGHAVPADKAYNAILDGVKITMDRAQVLINEQGKGFKGFLPAVFAKLVADEFSKTMMNTAFIKLTAPESYIRNRANKPDEWESKIIEGKFSKSDWPKDQEFAEDASHKGRPALRLMLPEYYGPSCLGCHGEPKGEKDITGGTKEGGKLGDLGGAISIAVYK